MALNLNVGILGHVDSGKTALAKVLSEIASTACFDKNPQSQTRGITLDLGFSSFSISTPDHLKNVCDCERIQLTLVDCPGHASLIRTIIGGAQIIDMMLLVIDVTKGIQTQTAECLVIGELLCSKMIVVLNKIDLIAQDSRLKTIEKMTKKIQLTLKSTRFADCPVINVAACPAAEQKPVGIDSLVNSIARYSFLPQRNCDAPFLFAIDHCFGIKGHGTVMTGTVLQGRVNVNDEIEIPTLKTIKKVKSMQMFKKQMNCASQGDRVGICVTQFDPKLLERGIAATQGHTAFANTVIMSARKIKYFKSDIKSKSKFHITVGHETTTATVTCFSTDSKTSSDLFDFNLQYVYEKELLDSDSDNENVVNKTYFLLLEFEKPALVVPNCTIIGSKLDMDIQTNSCRLAFIGTLLEYCKDKDHKTNLLSKLRVYKFKQKVGVVERFVNDNEVIVKNLFKKETNILLFLGLYVSLSQTDVGRIDGTFGQSGKVKIYFDNGFSSEMLQRLQQLKQKDKSSTYSAIEVLLSYKHNIYNVKEKIVQ